MKSKIRIQTVLAGLTAATLAGAALGAEGPVPRGVAPLDHVFLIMMENHAYGQVIGNPNMPFFNQYANHANLATNYFAVGHPSLTNYLEIVGGSNFGVRRQFAELAQHELRHKSEQRVRIVGIRVHRHLPDRRHRHRRRNAAARLYQRGQRKSCHRRRVRYRRRRQGRFRGRDQHLRQDDCRSARRLRSELEGLRGVAAAHRRRRRQPSGRLFSNLNLVAIRRPRPRPHRPAAISPSRSPAARRPAAWGARCRGSMR